LPRTGGVDVFVFHDDNFFVPIRGSPPAPRKRSMTLRYMHLAPTALCEAISLLNFGQLVGNAQKAAV